MVLLATYPGVGLRVLQPLIVMFKFPGPSISLALCSWIRLQ